MSSDDTQCSATALHALAGPLRCSLAPGHYDEQNRPGPGEPLSADPGGWHQSTPDREGIRVCWSDRAQGAAHSSYHPQ